MKQKTRQKVFLKIKINIAKEKWSNPILFTATHSNSHLIDRLIDWWVDFRGECSVHAAVVDCLIAGMQCLIELIVWLVWFYCTAWSIKSTITACRWLLDLTEKKLAGLQLSTIITFNDWSSLISVSCRSAIWSRREKKRKMVLKFSINNTTGHRPFKVMNESGWP